MNGSDHYHGWLVMVVVYSALLFVLNRIIIIYYFYNYIYICLIIFVNMYIHTCTLIYAFIYIYIYIFINRCKSLYKSYAYSISNYGPLTLRPRCCCLACLAMATADGTAVTRMDAAGAPRDSFPKVFGDGGSKAFGVVSVAYPKKGTCGIYTLDVYGNYCELIVLMYVWTIHWFRWLYYLLETTNSSKQDLLQKVSYRFSTI